MAKILIVDDDPDIVEASQLFLEKAGHTIATAYNRPDGLALFESFKPDLALLDVMMQQPDDGFLMAQELRRRGHKVPIMLLTSVASVSGLAFGPDDEMVPVDAFVPKPVEPAALIAQVAELLAR